MTLPSNYHGHSREEINNIAQSQGVSIMRCQFPGVTSLDDFAREVMRLQAGKCIIFGAMRPLQTESWARHTKWKRAVRHEARRRGGPVIDDQYSGQVTASEEALKEKFDAIERALQVKF